MGRWGLPRVNADKESRNGYVNKWRHREIVGCCSLNNAMIKRIKVIKRLESLYLSVYTGYIAGISHECGVLDTLHV